ncbi:MAG: AAA family ATPase [Candidatus Melainabacteria bacterium]|nr:AAA family ATPase [Candidatus Melainabacteria bacterium]
MKLDYSNLLNETAGEIKLSEEQLDIKNIIESTNKHLFITGKAGTGKSTLLQDIKENTKKRCVVVAPTGVAAVNVGGQTIHSLFRLPPKFITEEDINVGERTKKLLKAIDMVIIDEISMVRVELMDAIDIVLRKARSNNDPFGGVQIIMVGDLYQLPPVVKEEELLQYFTRKYGGIYFLNAKVWQRSSFEMYELKTVFRQEDIQFKHMLDCIREDRCSSETFNSLNERAKVSVPTNGVITLTSTNKIADQINEKHLNQLYSDLFIYEAHINGDFDQSSFPAELSLRLKKGAQVMFVRNDRNLNRWVNGTLGHVHSLTRDEVKVDIKGEIHLIKKETWEKYRYNFDEKTNSIKAEIVASFTQYPLKLAWAITIHKSQGKTLDSVLIDLGTGAFACGQTYVALSRCTSLDGIYLKRKITSKDILVDPKIIDFMKRENERYC